MAMKNTGDGKAKVPAKPSAKPSAKKAAPKKPSTKQMRTKKASDLPDKRMLFVKHYIANGFNATQAAISAGYSKDTAKTQASILLTFVDVQAALRTEARAMIEDVDMLKAKWLTEVQRVAFADVTDVISFDNSGVVIADSSTLTKDVTAAIESVSFRETITEHGGTKNIDVKMHSKMKAKEMLGKFLGLLIDKTEVEHTGELNFTNLTPEEFEKRKAELLAKVGK